VVLDVLGTVVVKGGVVVEPPHEDRSAIAPRDRRRDFMQNLPNGHGRTKPLL
jgi:hypothetical protein